MVLRNALLFSVTLSSNRARHANQRYDHVWLACSAGRGRCADHGDREPGRYLRTPRELRRAQRVLLLRVKGDSMIDAAILDGDLIVVEPQPDAHNGQIVVAMIDGEATVKTFYREAGRIRLASRRIALWSQSTSTECYGRRTSRGQSSDGSEPRLVAGFGWLEGRVAPSPKRFGNAPAVLALREALPISSAALIALGVLIVFFEHGDFVVRLKNGIPGAFAVMSIVLLLVLAVRLAQRLELPIVAMLAAAMCAFGLALPRAVWKSFTALAATLGTSGSSP